MADYLEEREMLQHARKISSGLHLNMNHGFYIKTF